MFSPIQTIQNKGRRWRWFLAALLMASGVCESASAEPVCFYEHVDFLGASWCTDESSAWVGSTWNDRISSVKVPAGTRFTLHEHASFGGRTLLLDREASNLVALQFNDTASSFTIEREKTSDPCVPNVPFTEAASATLSPSPTASPGKFCEMRGLWVWTSRDLLSSPAQIEEFRASARALGATDVFMYLTAADFQTRRDAVRRFVAALRADGISAWGLEGWRGYFSDEDGPAGLYASVDALVQYNQSVEPTERFVGFQSDMEPHDQNGFKATFHNELRDDQLDVNGGGIWQRTQALDREMLMRDWLTIQNTCRNKLTAAGMKFSAAMPSWTEDYYGQPVSATYRGLRQSVGRQMMTIVHDYVVMSYNTNPANAAARAAAQVQLASALPFERRPRVSAAVETHADVGRNVSYADTPGKNSKQVVLGDVDRIRATLGVHDAFGGVSVHDWEGWRQLPP